MQVSWDAERHRLVVTALNYTASAREVDLDLADVGLKPRHVVLSTMTAPSLSAYNLVANHDAIARKDWTEDPSGESTVRVSVPPFGLLHGVLEP